MLRLGSFAFDDATLTLTRDGELVNATPKTMELLEILARSPGAVVSHRAIREALWPEGEVEERNLPQQVYLLRRVLSAGAGISIENVPRRGYRLIVASTSVARRPSPARLRRWLIGASAALVILASGGIAVEHTAASLPSAAARAYELGRLQWERRDLGSLQIAERYFRETIKLAPSDARGYAGLAAVEAIRGNRAEGKAALPDFARARVLARSALKRDPRNADAFAVLGIVELDSGDMSAASALFRHAIALDSQSAYAHIWYGINLYEGGQVDDARREFEIGELLDPGSKTAARWLGMVDYDLHRFDAAEEQFHSALDLDPRDADSIVGLSMIDEVRKDYSRALSRLEGAGVEISDGMRLAAIARLEALLGRRAEARRTLAGMRGAHDVDPVELAATQLAVGDRSAALFTLRHQPNKHRNEIARKLKTDERFSALRQLALDAGGVSIN